MGTSLSDDWLEVTEEKEEGVTEVETEPEVDVICGTATRVVFWRPGVVETSVEDVPVEARRCMACGCRQCIVAGWKAWVTWRAQRVNGSLWPDHRDQMDNRQEGDLLDASQKSKRM